MSSAWNSTFGNGSVRSLITLPPAFVKLSLKPLTLSSPAAYFQVIVTAVLWPRLATTSPIANPGCQFEKEVRKMFGAHIGPVTASAPALGTISSVPLSLAALAIAIATPECTVPTTTSTWSRLISLLTLSVALDGSLSSSTRTNSTNWPPSLPPCSSRNSRKPFSIAVPRAA